MTRPHDPHALQLTLRWLREDAPGRNDRGGRVPWREVAEGTERARELHALASGYSEALVQDVTPRALHGLGLRRYALTDAGRAMIAAMRPDSWPVGTLVHVRGPAQHLLQRTVSLVWVDEDGAEWVSTSDDAQHRVADLIIPERSQLCDRARSVLRHFGEGL